MATPFDLWDLGGEFAHPFFQRSELRVLNGVEIRPVLSVNAAHQRKPV
jgi:hypothetical protein